MMKYNIDMYKGRVFNEDEDVIFFYSHKGSKKGLTKACFSQWWMCDFEENGLTFNCAEQWMMWNKAKTFHDEEIAEKILKATEQAEIKALGRAVRGFDPKVWDAVKKDIVVHGNVVKFSQNPELKEFILATGDKVLVEASMYDRIWGIGLRAHECDVSKWHGSNLLGFCLMEARDIIRQ